MKIASSPMAAIEALQLDAAYVAVAKSLGAADASRTWPCPTARSSTPRPAPRRSAARCSRRWPASTPCRGPGMLDFLLVFSLPKLVFDDEMCGQALRFVREVEPLDDLPVGELIDQLMADQHLIMAAAHDGPLARRALPAERDRRSRQPRGVDCRPGAQGHVPARAATRSTGGSPRTASSRPTRPSTPSCARSSGPGSIDQTELPSIPPAPGAGVGARSRPADASANPRRQRTAGGTHRMTTPARDPGHVRLVDALLRAVVPALAVLREDARGRLQRLRHLQPHVPAGLLRRPDRGVLGAAQRRDGLGRLGRADRRDHRTRRVGVHEHADLPRPHEVRRRPGQVRADHRGGRRDRQRPGAAPRRGRPLVARPRGQRRRSLGARRCDQPRHGRQGPRARGLSGPGPGPEVEGRHGRRCSAMAFSTSSTTGR